MCIEHRGCSQGGDLHDALHVGTSRLEWKAGGCRLAAQIALGLSKLHARKVSILAHVSTLHPASAPIEDEVYLQVTMSGCPDSAWFHQAACV